MRSYAVAVEADRFDEGVLAAALPPWIRAFRLLADTGSTNDDALEWAAKGAPEGSVVVAEHQRAGKGRLGRSWFAPAGGSLLFTVVLRPRIDPERLGLVNLGAAVAVCVNVHQLGVGARIKWPNDVTTVRGKLAGILSEHRDGAVCLGIGINVNVDRFPEEIAGSATSLSLETGRKMDRVQVLAGFLGGFEPLYRDLPRVPARFRPWCDTLGKHVRVNLPGRTVEARAVDIDSSGALILDTGEVVNAGDVVHLREGEPGP